MRISSPSRTLTTSAGVLLVALALTLGVGHAGACTQDSECDDGVSCTFIDQCLGGVCVPGGGGDTDGDGVCDADDNCPAVANADQADLDGDSAGDPCDENDRELNIVVAKMQRDLTPMNPKGRIFLKGDFLVTPPEGALSAATGFLVRVQDSVTPVPLDLTFSWAPSDCRANSKGVMKCKSPDKHLQLTLAPIAGYNGQNYRFISRLSRLHLSGPFSEPVLVTITNQPPVLTQGLDRVGNIVDCSQRNIGLVCRE